MLILEYWSGQVVDVYLSRAKPRILIISPNWIGDAVMAQPLLHRLKQIHPDCLIDVMAPAWVAPVWRAMIEVDTVMESNFKHGALQLCERIALARKLKQLGYADAYVLPNTFKFALIPWLAGIRRRIGYRGGMRYGLLNVIHRDEGGKPRPMVSFYAALADLPTQQAADLSTQQRPTMHVSREQKIQTAAQFGLLQDRTLLAFAPGSEFGSAKRWPTTHFAKIAQTVLQQFPTAQVILLGSGADKLVCDEIESMTPAVINLAGKTTLDQAIALIACTDAVVSNDSGLMHIASALNRPVIAIYGSTDPDHAPPLSDLLSSLSLRLECSPCRKRECPLGHHNCMKGITPDMLQDALWPLLR